eukprot:SAG22_NODE_4771_length_1168_cov_0.706268_1_plen_149_part_00
MRIAEADGEEDRFVSAAAVACEAVPQLVCLQPLHCGLRDLEVCPFALVEVRPAAPELGFERAGWDLAHGAANLVEVYRPLVPRAKTILEVRIGRVLDAVRKRRVGLAAFRVATDTVISVVDLADRGGVPPLLPEVLRQRNSVRDRVPK